MGTRLIGGWPPGELCGLRLESRRARLPSSVIVETITYCAPPVLHRQDSAAPHLNEAGLRERGWVGAPHPENKPRLFARTFAPTVRSCDGLARAQLDSVGSGEDDRRP
jgi:hypothetical protein